MICRLLAIAMLHLLQQHLLLAQQQLGQLALDASRRSVMSSKASRSVVCALSS